jgi:hypothetical protein
MQKQKLFKKLLKKPYLFRRIVTLSIEEFGILSGKLKPEWKQKEYERLSARENRKNKVGQGRKYELGNFSNLLLATCFYLRTNIGYELLSLIFDVDQSTLKRVVSRVTPLLTDRFIPKTEITKGKRRTNNLDELLEEFPELEDVIFDGTELTSKRPKKRQKQSYSGKKKRHTKKTVIALDKKTNIIVGVSPPKKGKVHDKKQLEQTSWDNKLSKDVNRYGDSGYQGMSKDNWIIPHKKPRTKELTKQQKRYNKKLAKQRIFVEHGIRGMKIFRRIGETLTIKSDEFLFNVLLASANLYNFKRLMRQGIS